MCGTKCALLIYTIIHRGGIFMVENPMTSLVRCLIFLRLCVCAEKFTPDMVLGIPHFKTSSYCINKMMHMLFLQFNYLAHVFNWVGLSSQTCWSVWCDPDPRSIHLAWGVRSGWDCDPKAHSTVVKQQFHSTPSKDCYFMMMIMMMMMMMMMMLLCYIPYIYIISLQSTI